MGYMTQIVVGAAATALGSIVAHELLARAPGGGKKIIESAVRILPDELRGTKHEEWLAHYLEIPGSAGKVAFALGCYRAALSISASEKRISLVPAIQRKAGEIGEKIKLPVVASLLKGLVPQFKVNVRIKVNARVGVIFFVSLLQIAVLYYASDKLFVVVDRISKLVF
ncbi:MAG TPA: hypothetical protein VN838_27915 [Bradyrhizobium sp.]|nr:hypothetical protein [Bradyrhizobium sp.]